MTPLSLLSQGDSAKILTIKGKDSVRKRIMDLGLVSGAELEVFSITPNSGTVVKLKDHRVVLDNDCCKRVFVTL